jgi:hypothetical protein
LTLFFFGLYFLSVNFFVILVFKNLKLRNIIYKIWYFFLYKFDYSEYENKNKKLIQSNFSETYSLSYLKTYSFILKNKVVNELENILNKNLFLNFTVDKINSNYINGFFSKSQIDNKLITNLNSLNIDEI